MITTSKTHSDHFTDALIYGFSMMKETPMGCDIHWYSETRQKDGTWACDQAPSFKIEDKGTDDEDFDMDSLPGRSRDYTFFGLLNQVRTNWDWSFEERASIPHDTSSHIAQMYGRWGSDAHSAGYLTREELKAKLEELKPLRAANLISPTKKGEVLIHHAKRLEDTIDNLSSDVPDSEQRIVFWFDN